MWNYLMILNHLLKCFVHISFFYHTSFDSFHVNLHFPSDSRVLSFCWRNEKTMKIYETCIFGISLKSTVVFPFPPFGEPTHPSHATERPNGVRRSWLFRSGVTCRGEDHHQANDLPASWGSSWREEARGYGCFQK